MKRCVEKKKILVHHNKVAKLLFNYFFKKNAEVGDKEAVTEEVL